MIVTEPIFELGESFSAVVYKLIALGVPKWSEYVILKDTNFTFFSLWSLI